MIAPSRFVQRSSTPRSILAVTVGFGLMAVPIVALEEQQVHPDSSTSRTLQRFTTSSSSRQKNPWAIEYPPENLRDPQHLQEQHKEHVHMKDGPASWHKGLQRWWHQS